MVDRVLRVVGVMAVEGSEDGSFGLLKEWCGGESCVVVSVVRWWKW